MKQQLYEKQKSGSRQCRFSVLVSQRGSQLQLRGGTLNMPRNRRKKGELERLGLSKKVSGDEILSER